MGIKSSAPKEQLSPKEIIYSLSRAVISDSALCPERSFPCLFTVAEIITGNIFPISSKISSAPTRAAFAFIPSKIVSIRIISAPPSIKPFICSL